MARWTAVAPVGRFAYDSKSVKRHWARLHACDLEALPKDAEVLQAWALFHNGQLHDAHRAGLRLGAAGATVANKAACMYATLLEHRESERLELYQQVSERAATQTQSEPDNPNAHYLLAYALGRYSQGISVSRALAQGLGSRIKDALNTTIALQPLHANAHFALGAFHAEIIDKVGSLIGGMTYGAKKSVSLLMFQRGFSLLPQSPSGLLEYAKALLTLEGDARQDEATALYMQAAALEPADAQEYLEIALARARLGI
jgi:hypothetical protein